MHCYELDGVFCMKKQLNLQEEFVVNGKNVIVLFQEQLVLKPNCLIFFETKTFNPSIMFKSKDKKLRDWPSLIKKFQENVEWAEPYFLPTDKILLFFFNGKEPQPKLLDDLKENIWKKYKNKFILTYYRAEKLTEFAGFLKAFEEKEKAFEEKEKEKMEKEKAFEEKEKAFEEKEKAFELLIEVGMSTDEIIEKMAAKKIIVKREQIELLRQNLAKNKCEGEGREEMKN